jgi:hypothetical protein
MGRGITSIKERAIFGYKGNQGVMEMKKALGIFAVFFLLSLSLGGESHAGISAANSGFRAYGSKELVGSTVKALDGEELGRISDLEIDSQGHVVLALILPNGSDGSLGKPVAVPFSALTVSGAKSRQIQVTLNAAKENFYAAPSFDPKDLDNPQWVAGLYRFFGQQPYWTEEEAVEVTTGTSQDLCIYPYSSLGEWGCWLDKPLGFSLLGH